MTNIDFVATMEPVARALLGEPNRRMSTRTALRFGNKGSLAVDLQRGRWFDHEAGEGGGVLDLVKRELRCETRDALTYLGAEPGQRPVARPATPKPPVDDVAERRRARNARHLWNCGEDPQGTLVETYLNSRGLSLPEDCPEEIFRFHPACPFKGERHPAMLALMHDPVTGEARGVHRTALTPEGKKIDRAMLSGAGAIMLTDAADVTTGLGIAEGIENAMTILQDGFAPMWAMGSAGGIKHLPVLAGIECLTIFADHDEAGLEAARECARRWSSAGRDVEIRFPDKPGTDWNDHGRI